MKKNSGIELLRVYACFLVLFAHIQISYMINGAVNTTSLIIKCIIGDNVPIFLIILGFFMFNSVQGDDRLSKIPTVYAHKIKGFLTRVYIPTIIVTLIACFSSDFVYGQRSFSSLFSHPDIHWEYLKSYILLQTPNDMVGQFWYIVAYMKVLIFFPVMALFCVDNHSYNIIRRVYIGLSFFNIILQDAAYMKNETFMTITNYVFDEHFLYVLIGFEVALFFRKTKLSRMKQILISAAILILGIGLRYFLTMKSFDIFGVGNSDHFMGLKCTPAYISSAGSLMLFYSLIELKSNKVIQFIGGMTLYVYMVQGFMLRKYSAIGSTIATKFSYGDTGIHAILYYLCYGFVIFITSFIFGFIIKFIYELICKLCSNLFIKNKTTSKAS